MRVTLRTRDRCHCIGDRLIGLSTVAPYATLKLAHANSNRFHGSHICIR